MDPVQVPVGSVLALLPFEQAVFMLPAGLTRQVSIPSSVDHGSPGRNKE